MTIDFKALFGDKESMTADELTEATKALKWVDLADGGYVGKDKFDTETKRLKALADAAEKKAEEAAALVKPDESAEAKMAELTKELEAVNKRLADTDKKAVTLEREKLVAAQVPNPKLAKLALFEAERMTSDDVTFEDALAKLIADDPEYTAPVEGGVVVTTGAPVKGKPAEPDVLAEKMAEAMGVEVE